jgi:CDGSH-type Zn-finger protein/uncharacterized Fe-S cluster protein YjdI
MTDRTQSYESDAIRVHYDRARCIHAERCVRGLNAVFDPGRIPWIDPTRGDAAEIAAAVTQCPTGALRFERLDGGAPEEAPATNTVSITADGPVYLRGALTLRRADGSHHSTDTRLALCRCGASTNKPFCDGSHTKTGFRDAGAVTREMSADPPPAGPLALTPRTNGSVLLEGPFQVVDGAGRMVGSLGRAGLCRCGHSKTKPFCDGSHRAAGFQAD